MKHKKHVVSYPSCHMKSKISHLNSVLMKSPNIISTMSITYLLCQHRFCMCDIEYPSMSVIYEQLTCEWLLSSLYCSPSDES